jgi:hypothetical protein
VLSAGRPTDVDVEGEAPEADALLVATVNESQATVSTNRFRARAKLAAGKRSLVVVAYDKSMRSHTGSFEVLVDEPERVPVRGRAFAILIANAHQDDSRRWVDLSTPLKDVTDMHEVLQSSYGFEATAIRDQDGREINLRLIDRNKKTILETIEDVAGLLGPGDDLLVYYAGHGWKPQGMDEAYWVPRDASGERLTSYISSDEIATTFKRSNARHILVVSDSCRSGKMWGAVRAEKPAAPGEHDSNYLVGVRNVQTKGRSRNALTSGADEDVADAGVAGNSLFAGRLLSVLKEPGRSAFLGVQLHSWVQILVTSAQGAAATGQVPQYFPIPKGGGEGGDFAFIFGSPPR